MEERLEFLPTQAVIFENWNLLIGILSLGSELFSSGARS
jgi:hypothetical protein